MNDVVIRVSGLSKEYVLGAKKEAYETLRESLTGSIKAPFRAARSVLRGQARAKLETGRFWALKDVSFEVRPGEVIGLIGRNGAGKSTLLKILSRITEPTSGWAEIRGRVGSLLEVGTGFHPELTGRENIYLNGTILGMRRHEITRHFDEIVAFAEVAEFVDTPVKFYSSGMYLRLAFGVAAHLNPEILLVDEVLAVGDATFQTKCLKKMGDVAQGGRTVLFVSHNMAAIERLCQRGIVITEGQITFNGPAKEGIARYLASTSVTSGGELSGDEKRPGRGRLRFTRLRSYCNDIESSVLTVGSDVRLEFDYRVAEVDSLPDIRMCVHWRNLQGELVFVCMNEMCGDQIRRLSGPAGTIHVAIPKFPVNVGIYRITAWIKSWSWETEDFVTDAMELTVQGGDFFGTGKTLPADSLSAVVQVPHAFTWKQAAN